MPSTKQEIAEQLQELSLEIAEAYDQYSLAALDIAIFTMDPDCREYKEAASTLSEQLAVLQNKTTEYQRLMALVLGHQS